MQNRKFSPQEAEQILARAARRQQEEKQYPGPHLTLEELEEAAHAAGIDESHVRAAAADVLRPSRAPYLRTFLGLPVEIRMSKLIQTRSDVIDWSTMVVGLRELFDRHGVATDLGTIREWASDASESKMPIRVVVEPDGDETRVTIERKTWPSTAGVLSGAAAMAAVGLMIVGLWVAGGGTSNIWIPALVFSMIAGLIGIGGYGLLRSDGRKTLGRFQAALDLVDESISSESRVAATSSTDGTAASPTETERDTSELAQTILDLNDEAAPVREITGPRRPRETER